MSSTLSKLNLRPGERRLVVGVGVVLFIVVNAFFVWPYFKDWDLTKNRLLEAQAKLGTFHGQVNQTDDLKSRVQSLEGGEGAALGEDQDIQLLRTIQMRAAETGVNITQTPRPTTQTNEFFLEQVQPISVQATEEQLVNFLHTLGSGNSMIRVRDLSLRPDPPRQQLAGTIKLVASFPRRTTARSPATPAGKTAATAPATSNR